MTVKKAFNVPYDQEGMPKLGTWEEAQALVMEEAKVVVDQMEDKEVKSAFERGEIK